MNKSIDEQYIDLLKDILENGHTKMDRTGTGTISVFGRQIRHNFKDGKFPILTTKRIYFKGIVTELLWFLRGDTNIKYLVDNDCHIWDGDAFSNYCKKNKIINVEDEGGMFRTEFINKIKTDDEFAKTWGDLGPIYGKQWRRILMPFDMMVIDQIANLIKDLKENPDSRRLMVNAWNVADLPVTDYRTDDELYQDYLKDFKKK